ncbi:zinc finger protein CONSTANS-LIKE 16-like [Heracleum sosnowskyi]|uniref:Zinc finger protein CONSTANS-LIKE 16-like n=1 Tax=Heracleum sosnowskyi TaxID=360622 RepID=A0AAD8MVV6_9APIA|nr:zinc finger protein CONSTANS-LIKE 16-like [Heracleum sosnowskyi]
MISSKKLASAVGGKTARACDSCIKKRARWYCAADDAFLCQACDSSVHSANHLAGRHERVRLKTASTESSSVEPSWHNGFKRKPRTPRKSKSQGVQKNPTHLVPEMGQDENSFEENDEQEQLLYRVPIFDLFADELCLPGEGKKGVGSDEDGNLSGTIIYDCADRKEKHSLHAFGESKNDIDEFAADVESLLGKGLDEESFDMETLGFLDCREKDLLESCDRSIEIVKLKEEKDTDVTMGINFAEFDITGEKFELNFDDYGSLDNCEEDKEAGGTCVEKEDLAIKNYDDLVGKKKKKKNILLALDYEGVISAWADKKRPWVTGVGRPELDLNDCWPDCMDAYGGVDYLQACGDEMGGSSNITVDEGRQARVLRYREKRRRRLFSKKIRYEVRKLNAEKRPRIKGRFVKRPAN